MNDLGNSEPAGSVFTDAERAFLHSQRLARLATIDSDGHPQNSPVGLHFNPDTEPTPSDGTWPPAASTAT